MFERENTLGYVANNLLASFSDKDEEESQKRQLEKIKKAAEQRGIKFLDQYHDKRLGGWDLCPDEQRRSALGELGERLVSKLEL